METASLFARLYLDEDVDVLVADLVQGQGFAATTARSEGKRGATDAEQLAFAAERGRVVVTHNRPDFEELAVRYFEEGRTHGGHRVCRPSVPARTGRASGRPAQ